MRNKDESSIEDKLTKKGKTRSKESEGSDDIVGNRGYICVQEVMSVVPRDGEKMLNAPVFKRVGGNVTERHWTRGGSLDQIKKKGPVRGGGGKGEGRGVFSLRKRQGTAWFHTQNVV